MSVSSALRHYYAYQKWKFTVIILAVTAIALLIGGIVFYYFIAAPAWQTFIDNLVAFFTRTGQSWYYGLADLQTYLLNHWGELLFLILFTTSIGSLIIVLIRAKRRHRVLLAGVLTIATAVTGFGLISTFAVNQGFIKNPFGDVPVTPSPTTHYYITVQFDGYFKGGDDLFPSELQVSKVTVSRQTAVGELTSVKHDFVGSPTWTLREDKGTGIVRVYATITYSDGSKWGETQLWYSSHAPNSQFDWTYRFDCPHTKTPVKFQLRIELLDYFWIWHYGYKTVYSNTWTF